MKEVSDVLLLLTTFPNEQIAEEIALILVGEKLAACCTVIPGVRSVYRWEGAVVGETEYLMLIKTTEECYERLQSRLVELHPFDLPELIALPVLSGSETYLNWIRASTTM